MTQRHNGRTYGMSWNDIRKVGPGWSIQSFCSARTKCPSRRHEVCYCSQHVLHQSGNPTPTVFRLSPLSSRHVLRTALWRFDVTVRCFNGPILTTEEIGRRDEAVAGTDLDIYLSGSGCECLAIRRHRCKHTFVHNYLRAAALINILSLFGHRQ